MLFWKANRFALGMRLSHDRHATAAPTQVYEAGFHFVCVLVFLWCYQRGWFPGQLAKIYLITYALFRFATEWLRPELPIYAGLTGYQVASLVMAGLFSWLLWRDLKLGTKPELRQETA